MAFHLSTTFVVSAQVKKESPREDEERKLVNVKITNRRMNHTQTDCPWAVRIFRIDERQSTHVTSSICLNGFLEENNIT